jgi:hypothetical protein
MAGPFGCRFVFKELWDKTSGWTMNFWNGAPDLNTAIAAAKNLAPYLNGATGNQAGLTECRIHDASNPRSAQIVPLPGFGPLTTASPTSINNTATPLVSLLLRAYSSDGTIKAEYELRGIRAQLIINGGQYSGAPGAQLTALIAALVTPPGGTATGWLLRGKLKTRPKQSITAITPTGLVTMAGPLDTSGSATVGNVGIVYLERVIIGNKSRTWLVSSNPGGGSTLQLILGSGLFANIQVRRSSAVRPVVYATGNIGSIIPSKITTHDVGRPLDTSTGHPTNRPR